MASSAGVVHGCGESVGVNLADARHRARAGQTDKGGAVCRLLGGAVQPPNRARRLPITLTGSYDPTTNRSQGSFVVAQVARTTTGTWIAA
jgi:hypothetical protein